VVSVSLGSPKRDEKVETDLGGKKSLLNGLGLAQIQRKPASFLQY
jgi:hypothetical protein